VTTSYKGANDMAIIHLKNGAHAIVDDEDYEWLSQYKWHLSSDGYAKTCINDETIYMHRFILNPPKGMWSDHINRNRLDNHRHNLRVVTPRENAQNKSSYAQSPRQPKMPPADIEYTNAILDEARTRLHITSDLKLAIRFRSTANTVMNLRNGQQNHRNCKLFQSILTYLGLHPMSPSKP
jgi:hypothetical protein